MTFESLSCMLLPEEPPMDWTQDMSDCKPQLGDYDEWAWMRTDMGWESSEDTMGLKMMLDELHGFSTEFDTANAICQPGQYAYDGFCYDCYSGYYCPGDDYDYMCPVGTFCPAASVEPTMCPEGMTTEYEASMDMSSCVEGSTTDGEGDWTPDMWVPDVSDCILSNEVEHVFNEQDCYFDEELFQEVCVEDNANALFQVWDCNCPYCETYITATDMDSGEDQSAYFYDPTIWLEFSMDPTWHDEANQDVFFVWEFFNEYHMNSTDYEDWGNMTDCDELVEVFIEWATLEQDMFAGETHIFYNRCEPWFNCTHYEAGAVSNCSEEFYNAEWWFNVSSVDLWYEYPEYLDFKYYWDDYHFGDWEDEWEYEPIGTLPNFDDEFECYKHNTTVVEYNDTYCPEDYAGDDWESVCEVETMYFFFSSYNCMGNQYVRGQIRMVNDTNMEAMDVTYDLYDPVAWSELSEEDFWYSMEAMDAWWVKEYFDNNHTSYYWQFNDTDDCSELVEVYIVWDELEQDLFMGESHLFYNRCEPWFNCTHYENGEYSNCTEDFFDAEWWYNVSSSDLWYDYPEY